MNVLKWTDDLLKNPARAWADIASGRGLPARLAAAIAVTTLCSGAFGMAAGSYVGVRQALITGYKMPLLLLSTLAICVPVMYIVNAVTVRRLSVLQVVSIGVTSITTTAIVLGAFAPVMVLLLSHLPLLPTLRVSRASLHRDGGRRWYYKRMVPLEGVSCAGIFGRQGLVHHCLLAYHIPVYRCADDVRDEAVYREFERHGPFRGELLRGRSNAY